MRKVKFASSKRRAESMRCCLASVCVGCLFCGSQRTFSICSTRFSSTLVPVTQLSNSAVASAAMGIGRLLRRPRSRLPLQGLEALYPLPVSAMAAVEIGQSLPWERSHLASSFQPSFIAGLCPVRSISGLLPSSGRKRSTRVRSSRLSPRGSPRLSRLHSRPNPSLQRTVAGKPAPAAELQR
jgi:hypothetical protein